MTAEYEGNEVKQPPLTILQLLARRVDDDGNNKVLVRDMMDETNLSRGSIYNYLNNTLAPLGLAGITGSKSTPGAASDAKYWGITQEGYDWVTSLGPDDLAPVEASSEAVKRAERAVEIANDARATAEELDDQIDALSKTTADLETNTESAFNNLKDRIDSVDNDLDELHDTINRTQSTANEPDQTLARDIRHLSTDIEDLREHIWNLDIAMRGDPNDDTDQGITGDLRYSIETLNETHSDQQRRIRLLTALSTGAVILAVIAIVVALL